MRRTGHSSYSIARDRGAPEVADSGGPPAMGRWGQSATGAYGSSVRLAAGVTVNGRRSDIEGAGDEGSTERTMKQHGEAAVTYTGVPAGQQSPFYRGHLTDDAQADTSLSCDDVFGIVHRRRRRRIVTVS